MKKRILIVYPQMSLGGSTTSLLSLLHNMDYGKYEIDLLLFWDGGPYRERIPPQVRVLPCAYRYQDPGQRRRRKLLSFRYMRALLFSKIISVRYHSAKAGMQYLASREVDFFRLIETDYDIAIGYLEGYSNTYVAKHVTAGKKIAWIHIDYLASGYFPEFDEENMRVFDRIVTVSEKCREAYRQYMPSCAGKVTVIENMLSAGLIRALAAGPCAIDGFDRTKLNMVSCCRIAFASKGLDRAVRVLAGLKSDGLLDRVCWYIIGDGPDYERLRSMIEKNGLGGHIRLLGLRLNPYPYMKAMDVLFMPSVWEGKPMAVTEALMLGVPPFVTEYASAREQIRDGYDGIIVENSERGIDEGLRKLFAAPSVLRRLRKNIRAGDYSNPEEMKKIEALFDE